MQIAIDGPAASGKSTVAHIVARRLGLLYVDTGAMYRAVTWAALDRGVSTEDPDALTALAAGLALGLAPDTARPEGYRVEVDGRDITEAIVSAAVAARVSQVAAVPGVRRCLVAAQQRMAESKGVVMAGRDIGTVVLPHATLKVYLDASEAERVRRRLADVVAAGGPADPGAVARNIRTRDEIDSQRADSPLRPAADAVMVDTTGRSIDQVVDGIVELARARGAV